MKIEEIGKNIYYVGVEDKTIDLFESQYIVPKGITYNSYIIKDKKNLIVDTVDSRKTDEWIEKVENVLNGENLDYLIVSHLEPDHSGSIDALISKYPEMKIVGNAKTFAFIPQFIKSDIENRKVLVAEGEELNIGEHTFKFIMAPMVHWPEVMVEYEKKEKILFSADAFGTFGILENEENWYEDAGRYYFNIVGKYGIQVQALLKKAATLDISKICSLHGPILKENLEKYIKLYDVWSRYEPEEEGITIAYTSIHGNTKKIAEKLAKDLIDRGEKVAIYDLSRGNLSYAIADAFRYSKLVLLSATYNMQLFPPMQSFLSQLQGKNYQNRKLAIIENGSWAPNAANCIKEFASKMKDITIYEPIVTVRTTLNEESKQKLENLLENLVK